MRTGYFGGLVSEQGVESVCIFRGLIRDEANVVVYPMIGNNALSDKLESIYLGSSGPRQVG